MPTKNLEADWQELGDKQINTNKTETYINFLGDSKAGKQTGHYKINDILPYLFYPSGSIDSELNLFSGVESLQTIIQGYELYSDGYFSDPLDTIPTTINIHEINGISNKNNNLPEQLEDIFKAKNPETTDLILNNSVYSIPKQVNIEKMLEFAGNVTSYEGGAKKWQQYKENPNVLTDNFFNIPKGDFLLETDNPNVSIPKYQAQNLGINSDTELLLLIAGTIYNKAGLNEFPSNPLPTLNNLQP